MKDNEQDGLRVLMKTRAVLPRFVKEIERRSGLSHSTIYRFLSGNQVVDTTFAKLRKAYRGWEAKRMAVRNSYDTGLRLPELVGVAKDPGVPAVERFAALVAATAFCAHTISTSCADFSIVRDIRVPATWVSAPAFEVVALDMKHSLEVEFPYVRGEPRASVAFKFQAITVETMQGELTESFLATIITRYRKTACRKKAS